MTDTRFSAYRRKDGLFGILSPDGVTPVTNTMINPTAFSAVEGGESPYWHARHDIVARHISRLNKEGQPA